MGRVVRAVVFWANLGTCALLHAQSAPQPAPTAGADTPVQPALPSADPQWLAVGPAPASAWTITHWPSLTDYRPPEPDPYSLGALAVDPVIIQPHSPRQFMPYQTPDQFAADPVLHTRLLLSDPDRWPTYVIQDEDRNWIDATRDYVHQTAERPVVWFDGFFALRRGAASEASHDLRLTPRLICTEHGDCETDIKVKSRITLPYTEERLKLLLTNEDPDTLFDTLDRTDTSLPQEEGRNPFSAALSWALATTENYRINLSSGAQGGGSPNVFVQASTSGRLELSDRLLLSAGQSVFYRSDEGAGARTQLDLDIALRDGIPEELRFRNRLDASEEFTGIDYTASLEYLRQVNRNRAWGLGIGAETNVRRVFNDEGYRLWFRYRKRFYREWLFWEVRPFLRWVEESGMRTDPGINLNLEIYLDRD